MRHRPLRAAAPASGRSCVAARASASRGCSRLGCSGPGAAAQLLDGCQGLIMGLEGVEPGRAAWRGIRGGRPTSPCKASGPRGMGCVIHLDHALRRANSLSFTLLHAPEEPVDRLKAGQVAPPSTRRCRCVLALAHSPYSSTWPGGPRGRAGRSGRGWHKRPAHAASATGCARRFPPTPAPMCCTWAEYSCLQSQLSRCAPIGS